MNYNETDLLKWTAFASTSDREAVGYMLNELAKRIAALEATERQLREAVRVLAVEVVAIEKLLAAGTPVMKPVGYFLDSSVLSNPIASAAVREVSK